ncbi:hypothetical protein BDV95DRAFT_242475 [Massariosphaeria phaeospora]|uniref:Oxidase ustYa n=1 Tax=Massariosphaeria phaeospora TaxID=100035 RepID=A0A7C8MFL9_9PLEO|nr:hypothetical protein BDV95DRAFT_242475 [Massariosphaeria phaeospora]
MPAYAPHRSLYDVSTSNIKAEMKTDQRYDALRNLDDDSRSSTEVEDWEPESEVRPRRKRKTFWKKAKAYRWMVDTALLLVIVGLLAEKRLKKWSPHKSHRYELAGDITGFAPEFSQQIVSFTPNHTFAPENASSFWDHQTQNAWLDIVPMGLGYVNVKSPALHDNLPTPIHDYPNQTVYTTSVTHQLHCLYTILEAYNILQASATDPFFSRTTRMPWHINHCFEYLRQAVMCAGDVALEGAATSFPPDPETGEDRGGSDGWDARHVCRDYSQVYAYLERETLNRNKWISSD